MLDHCHANRQKLREIKVKSLRCHAEKSLPRQLEVLVSSYCNAVPIKTGQVINCEQEKATYVKPEFQLHIAICTVLQIFNSDRMVIVHYVNDNIFPAITV